MLLVLDLFYHLGVPPNIDIADQGPGRQKRLRTTGLRPNIEEFLDTIHEPTEDSLCSYDTVSVRDLGLKEARLFFLTIFEASSIPVLQLGSCKKIE